MELLRYLLNRTEFYVGFLPAALLHLIMVMTRTTTGPLRCITNCEEIYLFDAPVSILYFLLPGDGPVILASALLGTVWWGLGGLLVLYLLDRVVERLRSG
ncbi:MAG: hypothetical protein H7A21_12660 [Spirochaetales bacterium]|nr:hypothetical protein [Leptospiraceae bacterium]MCP5482279.1 hypothetical protein [Spirochaetales bacterium]MCP5484609.1 hypothetical protein [Spirochaetales bacterium]